MSTFGVQFVGLVEARVRFGGLTSEQRERAARVTREQTELLAQAARDRIAQLFRTPGRMQAAIRSEVESSGDVTEGRVIASGLPYLRIQEYGGVIKTPVIFPKRAKALAFFYPSRPLPIGKSVEQDRVFAKWTRAHDTKIPERSYMRAALAQRRNAIRAAFMAVIATP